MIVIIITASILNLGFKNNCAKNIGAYNMHKQILKYTQILAVKNQAKLIAKNKTGRTDCENHKMLKCWRPPTIHKISVYIKNVRAYEMSAP